MTVAWLVERLPPKYTGDGETRKARANLDQLCRKELVDKRPLSSRGAKRNVYRPWGHTLGREGPGPSCLQKALRRQRTLRTIPTTGCLRNTAFFVS